jgi:hypothetical protein
MPAETITVLVAIGVVFAIFMVTLAWASKHAG